MINFNTDRTFKGLIDLNMSGTDEVQAELTISPRKFIYLKFTINFRLDENIFNSIENIVFKSDEGSFLLYQIIHDKNTVQGFLGQYRIKAERVLFTFKTNYDWKLLKITKISVNTENLNLWLNSHLPEGYIERIQAIDSYKKQIDVNITLLNTKNIHIYDTFSYQKHYPKDGNYKLDINSFVNLETNTSFEKENIDLFSRNIELILSMLTGVKQNIHKVKVNDFVYFYRPNNNNINSHTPSKISWTSFLLRTELLQQKNLFPTIFSNFFSKLDHIENAYAGFWGLHNASKDSFWEDDFFRLFSMLDSITSEKKLDTQIPFTEEDFRRISLGFNKILTPIVNNVIETQKPDDNTKLEYEKILNHIANNLDNRLNYRQKIKKMFRRFLSKEAVKIIDISKDNLHRLTEMRNALAHGDDLGDDLMKHRYTVYYKILLLIYYLLWKDLGLDDDTIFFAIEKSMHVINRFANEKELEIYTGTPLLLISHEQIANLKLLPHAIVIGTNKPAYSNLILEKKDGTYSINVEKNKTFKEIQKKKKGSFAYKDIALEIYPNFKNFEYKSKVWIETEQGFSDDISQVFIVEL